jgi:hypothetical protein
MPGPEIGQSIDHVGACDARTKKAVAINLTDVSDLVTDWSNLADGSLSRCFPSGAPPKR